MKHRIKLIAFVAILLVGISADSRYIQSRLVLSTDPPQIHHVKF